MPCASACRMLSAFCTMSKPPITMPSGLSAIACPNTECTPDTLPWPSSTRMVQPMRLPASFTPSPASWMPPLRMSPAMYTTVLPTAAFGPLVGPSHFAAGAVAASTVAFACATTSCARAACGLARHSETAAMAVVANRPWRLRVLWMLMCFVPLV